MQRMADMIAQLIKDEYLEVDRQVVFNIIMVGFSFTPVGQFFVENCRMTYQNYYTSFRRLYNRYKEWCIEKDYEPISGVKFSQEMVRLGAKRKRTGDRGVYFTGILLTRDVLRGQKPHNRSKRGVKKPTILEGGKKR